MDKMDRLLKHLPRHAPDAHLAARICSAVRRRHHRRQRARQVLALVFGLSGLWLALPGVAWFSVDLTSTGMPWLMDGMNYLNRASLQAVGYLWNDLLSLQEMLGSSLMVSVWLGILLMGFGLLFTIDQQVFQMPVKS